MRCYFHVRGPNVHHLDTRGVEASDLKGAVAEAAEVLQELRRDWDSSEDWDGWWLEISDDRGTVLSTLPF